ncbi:Uncharacterised protein [Mycolicibacterium flavescens]|uniref:hypothetical protein n=1 Tax=Mycobacterium neumannii TaxID=2048551 RepID=UPI000F71320E|nr:hypothetical protein [Mycobacterium neumannii]VEG39405.1 Uncharacterised protein [Mycolicibacterium flavescens]
MPLAEHTGPVGLRIPGLYRRIKTYELAVSLRPDPRLVIGDVSAEERAALASQAYAPTALNQVESLRHNLPVTVPRWYIGGRSYPEVNGWHPYDNRRVDLFIVFPNDDISPR